ncbi:sensory neuron membrane protein 2-like [Diprion similis]|uniref:sensory neuron membrane protein 2-like n=1 Tax=Diprion similis TaxID=362088 RepID=UPI001EF96A42|nr:sensory neuron membrane protein 2-like [Diprion similis]
MWTSNLPTFSLGFGIFLIIIGTIAVIIQPHGLIMENLLDANLALVKGTLGFSSWAAVKLEFKVYLFHVTNPIDVQERGEVANIVERGPYVYDELLEKTVIGTDEAADTIEYLARRTLVFNATKSGNLSENDEVTILNAAHVGSLITIADGFPALLSKFGNAMALLFSDPTSIFMRGRVRDILFDGLPLVCDPKSHPELVVVCGLLKRQRPPTLRTTSEDGIYAFSFFHKINGTYEGPMTASRGVKDRYTIGHLSEFKGLPYADFWSIKNCSIVRGTDSIFWPPMSSRQPEVFTFINDLCRSVFAVYKNDTVYSGLLGYYYSSTKSLWNDTESTCYCPREKKKLKCPTQGLLDLNKCQEVPIMMSEPHFLHGDESLFSITNGLQPDEEKHATYVVVEPFTGAPLSGYRKMQLNLKLRRLKQVHVVANVTEGMFPLLWVEEGTTPGPKILAPVILIHRTIRLLVFLSWMPLLFGIFFVAYSYWMNTSAKTEGSKASGRSTLLAVG